MSEKHSIQGDGEATFTHATKLRPSHEALTIAHKAGVAGVEFWTNGTILDDVDGLHRLALEFPFRYVIHSPNKANLEEHQLRNLAELYRRLECRAMVIHEPILKRYGQRLLEMDDSLRLGVENHKLSPSEFDRWADSFDWLTLDVEHLWMYTIADGSLDALIEALEDFLRQYGDKLIHVHLPGYLPGCDEHRPMYCSRDMILSVLSKFSAFGYSGLIVGEANPEYQNEQELRMDALLVERWRQGNVSTHSHTTRIGA